MLTYDLSGRGNVPLYEYLYSLIRNDIIAGRLSSGEKLPSKRTMADNHSISVITVENAYEQLVMEGYIEALPKRGYFVARIEKPEMPEYGLIKSGTVKSEPENETVIDLSSNRSENFFPYSIWSKLMRKNLADDKRMFKKHSDGQGVKALREAIAYHLREYRGLNVSPDNIIVGAGTEYLYGLIVQLLGRNGMIAVEEPGHLKVSKVYEMNGVKVLHIPVDQKGLSVESLKDQRPIAVHISPSHHFPTGVVMPATRRHELLNFSVGSGSYIIEDDYDSEFRFNGKPIPTFASLDSEHVIYMNTFSKTLSPAIRIAYMVLPDSLMERYRDRLSFYSGTVSDIEQFTLADFMAEGYFERHINRMRNLYKGFRKEILTALSSSELSKYVKVEEKDSGLHFILDFESSESDGEIIERLRKKGIAIKAVSNYCFRENDIYKHKLIVNYSDIDPELLRQTFENIRLCILGEENGQKE